MGPITVVILFIAFLVVITLIKTAVVVPNKAVYVIEKLGKYCTTLEAGFHILVPWLDKIAYKHSLKEQVYDVDEQICITKDNISVKVDGVLYFQIFDPVKASYGVDNYRNAIKWLAQTTMRSEIGKLELDKTFEEREKINSAILSVIDEASDPWGVKVTRYEIKNIIPPVSIEDAMEKQMKAEREKRAVIAESQGEKQAQINRAQGKKEEAIQWSEGEKIKRINEAEGHAAEIFKIAEAHAKGLKLVAEAISQNKGEEAVSMKIAEQFITEFGKLAKTNNTMIIPTNMSDIAGTVASLTKVLTTTKQQQ
jgi:regulator of protease activity HflC (stomatin/prohibitin superfamily)